MNAAFASFASELTRKDDFLLLYQGTVFENLGAKLREMNSTDRGHVGDIKTTDAWARQLEIRDWYDWIPVDSDQPGPAGRNGAIETLKISMVREPSRLRYRLATPLDAARTASKLIGDDLDREVFGIFLVDTRNRITGMNIVSVGSLNGSLVHPRECYEAAILGNAAALILFHNHPSGDPSPSREDIAPTKRLQEAGKIIGIEVLDHVVLGAAGTYASFKERELI